MPPNQKVKKKSEQLVKTIIIRIKKVHSTCYRILFLFQEVVLFLVSVPLDDHRETGKLLPMQTRNDPIQRLPSMAKMISPYKNVNKSE